jgi:hypothetical protein
MRLINQDAEAKTVSIREYLRCRNGKWEHVRSHLRRPRRKRSR